MPDAFGNYLTGLDDPYTKAVAITPDDNNDLATNCRAVYIGGGAGALSVVLADDSAAVTFSGLLTGHVYRIRAKRIRSTGTSATGIVALS